MKNKPRLSPSAQKAIAQYKRDGYYIARGLLSQAKVKRIFAQMHSLVIQQLEHRGLPVRKGQASEAMHDNLHTLFTHDQKTYLATLTLASKLAILYELYSDKNLLAFARAVGIDVPVWQTGPVLHLMAPALKIPGGYYGFAMHQDWPSQQGSLDAVTVWVPFVDVDKKMHTMEVIPGSHTKGLYPSSDNKHILEIDPKAYDPKKTVRIEAKRGDAVFFSAFMLHRSCESGDDRLRVAASIRYESATEQHFIERGYPAAQKRWAIKELLTPHFPTEKQLKDTFT